MSTRPEMLSLLRSRKKFFSLPQRFYNDPSFFDIDLETIFCRRWIFAGLECEISEPGEYVTLAVGRSSIIVLRNEEGDVRAFFNTCRHRGSRICDTERGKAKRLACPYHQWTYDLDGRLRYAGRMHQGFDSSGISLKPVRVETLEGIIYVCLAEDAPDFAPYGAALRPYLLPHDLRNAKLAHSMNLVENGNWKLVMENSRECYHCPSRHPELMHTFKLDFDYQDPQSDPTIAAYWEKWTAAGLPSGLEDGEDYRMSRIPLAREAISISMDGKPAVSRLLGKVPDGNIGSLRWTHYPSMFAHVLGDYAFFFRMLPIAPEQTLVTAKWIVNRDAEEGRDYDLQNLVKVWAATNDQDLALVERNQRGINSIGYEPGPYSQETETGVIKFVEWYCREMERQLGTAARTPEFAV